MDATSEPLSISEMFVIGKKKYGDNQIGLENWKTDLLKFVSEDFHDLLNSEDSAVQKKANDELALWINTTDLSFFFKGMWGDEYDNKNKALQYLHHAQILERKFNDQFVIQVINRAIRACLENRFQFME